MDLFDKIFDYFTKFDSIQYSLLDVQEFHCLATGLEQRKNCKLKLEV